MVLAYPGQKEHTVLMRVGGDCRATRIVLDRSGGLLSAHNNSVWYCRTLFIISSTRIIRIVPVIVAFLGLTAR
uniref:Uncharacterized protein n=1 Tax=Physcomitrium patens TaxID=3218 RepID=A0A2K1JHP4_PHYPA|nr:hypothetical protein PHYPA_018478 [Physcomitrium patens]